MRSSILPTFIIAAGLFCAGCGSGAATSAATSPDAGADQAGAPKNPVASSPLARETAVLTATEQVELADGLSGFAFALWQELRRDPATANNYAFSPVSLSLALGMAYAGAKAETAAQMEAAVHIANPGQPYLRSLNWLDQQLASRAGDALKAAQDTAARSGGTGTSPNPTDYRLHVINACWGDRTLSFQPSYLATLATDFGSGVHLADFQTQPEVERLAINNWVAQETLDRIKDLITPGAITAATRVVLVNAIHLKLPWYEPFQRVSTQPDIFTKGDGTTVEAAFMHRKASLLYTEDDSVQVASLPLAGSAVEFIVFLPNPTTTLAQFEDALSSSKMQSLVAALKYASVTLALPKFVFTTGTVRLATPLITLGMTDAFTPNADFTGITQEKLFISDVLHKAMIGVDENGVEAAAASAVLMKLSLVPDGQEMTLNRPFVFGLYDRPTASWLFLGQVTDPSQGS
jgi:serpin B